MADKQVVDPDDNPRLPRRWEKVFYVLLSPFILAWTGWHFWRLFTTGRMYVNDGTGVVDTDSGFNFWAQLGLYALLLVGASVVLLLFFHWLLRRRSP